MASADKLPCRLCYYDTTDTVDLFGDAGLEKDYVRKIRKYLYLLVQDADEKQRQSICWMCSQQLEAFHQFFTKINEIQKSVHKEHYEEMVLPDPVPRSIVEENAQKENHPTEETFIDTPTTEHSEVESKSIIINSCIDLNISSENLQQLNESSTLGRGKRKKMQTPRAQNQKGVDKEKHDISVEESDDPEFSKVEKRQRIEQDAFPANQSPTYIKQEDIISIQIEADEAVYETVEVAETEKKSDLPEQPISLDIVQVKQENISVAETPPVQKKGRGRPKGSKNVHTKAKIEKLEDQQGSESEGEPSTDVEEWTPDMENFPSKILKNGLLLYRGPKMMAMVSKYYPLNCDICDTTQQFTDVNELFNHYTDEHQTKGYLICCNSKMVTYASIIMHMAKHLQPDAFTCETCGYIVTRPRFLDAHRKTHLPDDQKPFACFICHRTFCWKTALLTHMISHQPPEERKKYVCHVCGKTYDTPGALSTHRNIKHSEKPKESHVCHVCAKNFSSRAGLSEHMATIHQPREINQVQCPKCNKWCMNKRCLKTHMLLHTGADLECPLCDYKTRKKTLLARHQTTKHSDLRPFPCDQCNRAFKFKRALTVHLNQAHSTETVLHECNFCDRKFRSSTNFYTHRKNSHPVELDRMRRQQEEEQRMLRIEAGIEDMGTDDECKMEDGEIEIEIIPYKEEDDEAADEDGEDHWDEVEVQ